MKAKPKSYTLDSRIQNSSETTRGREKDIRIHSSSETATKEKTYLVTYRKFRLVPDVASKLSKK